MDIDQHVNQIVQNIVADITTKVQAQAADAISQKIDEVLSTLDYSTLLSDKLSQKLDIKLSSLPIDKNTIETELTNRVNNLARNLSVSVEQQSLKIITDTVSGYVSQIDFKDLYQKTIVQAVANAEVTFPVASIPHSSIQFEGLTVSGNQVIGGIIQQFGSTGIDDQSTVCQLTIMDDLTVVENNLLTKDLTVKGTTTIEGDLNVTGEIPETSAMFIKFVNAATNNVRTSLDQVVFKSYADMVIDTIKKDGLDLTKIKLNGEEVINGGNLSNAITFSNLQRVGQLNELQVRGETLLGETVYVSGKRVGINTIEPTQSLSIWDQEIEVGIGKQSTNTAIIGAPRNQTLVISANNKNNLTLLPDGSVSVNRINLGSVSMSSSDKPPMDNQPKGTIMFNSNPSLGGPLGWVSLGDARWANFGIID
jgi:hypothetical protein